MLTLVLVNTAEERELDHMDLPHGMIHASGLNALYLAFYLAQHLGMLALHNANLNRFEEPGKSLQAVRGHTSMCTYTQHTATGAII